MTRLRAPYTYARVNHGRWIADCPRPYCFNAMRLTPEQITFHCEGHDGCGMHAAIAWPDDPARIWTVLEERPVPATRNWYPKGHPEAVQLGIPHGQTVTELREEHRAYEGAM